eukprot:GHUV01035592.1.p1 GENE.GHUV01035592.1~~GHUV01035592.1.p1  ORF type:complete len:114 (+),score=47.84 GHUV01035592.1:59-400(+)
MQQQVCTKAYNCAAAVQQRATVMYKTLCGCLQMSQLRELDVSGNLLTELPQALGVLPKLEVCMLKHISCTARSKQCCSNRQGPDSSVAACQPLQRVQQAPVAACCSTAAVVGQ